MEKLQIKNLSKYFGETKAVDNLFLDLYEGELLAILGPSGSGKSTLLSCIAGIENPNQGEIYLSNKCIFSSLKGIQTSPEARKIGFVFQNYALWPHMTVFANIAYPLKMAKVPIKERKEKVNNTLHTVGLDSKTHRYPNQLSGGEQQRVALARALIMNPDLLLLDEPLSNLDAKLRENMQIEIRKIQQKLNLTVIHVTHDQAEAMAMADRIAIMDKGAILQMGTPKQIYETPKTQFVANFVGTNTILSGILTDNGKGVLIDGSIDIKLQSSYKVNDSMKDEHVCIAIRPENIHLYNMQHTPNEELYNGKIINKIYKGAYIMYEIQSKKITLRVQSHPVEQYDIGEKIYFSCESCVVIDKKAGY